MDVLAVTGLVLLGILAAALLFIMIVVLFGWAKVYFSYSEGEGVKIAASVFGVKITLYPRKKKDKKEKKPKEKPEEKPEKTPKEEKKSKKPSLIPETTGGKIRLFFEILEVVKLRFRLFVFKLYLLYGTGDAAKTATDIGKMHAAVASFFALASNAVKVDPVDVVITPNFIDSSKKAETEIVLGLKILSAVITALRVYKTAVKFRKKESEEK
ncbi:MAG: DUF2953 domain-containing protein [Clostridia bacterium]|nr:DUF2953 domain-containing protein [Clostridia bacterium]